MCAKFCGSIWPGILSLRPFHPLAIIQRLRSVKYMCADVLVYTVEFIPLPITDYIVLPCLRFLPMLLVDFRLFTQH